jgi:hypothetical protein
MKDCCNLKDFCKFIPVAAVIILVIAGVAAFKLAIFENLLSACKCCKDDCCDCD